MADKPQHTNFTDINSVLSLQLSFYEDYILQSLDFYLNRRKFAQEHCWEAKKYSYATTYPNDSSNKNVTVAEIEITLDQLKVEQQAIDDPIAHSNVA